MRVIKEMPRVDSRGIPKGEFVTDMYNICLIKHKSSPLNNLIQYGPHVSISLKNFDFQGVLKSCSFR
jgi:hypothetical protein